MVPVLVPPDWVKTTVEPLVVRLLPAASRACSVRVVPPPEVMLPLPTVTVDVAVDTAPGVTVIVGSGVDVTAVPPIVAPMVVAVPAIRPVNVAV